MLCTYRRTGGPPPSDDERLEVDEDGSFTLWRTNADVVAGAFAGRLSSGELTALKGIVAALPPPEVEVEGPVRGAALEQLSAAGEALAVPSSTSLPDAWAELADHLRRLVLDGIDEPVAALRASLTDGGGTLVLEVVGTEPLDVDLDQGTVEVHATDYVNEVWTGKLAEAVDGDAPAATMTIGMLTSDRSAWTRQPGWTVRRPLPHGLDPGGGLLIATTSTWVSWRGQSAVVTVRPSWPASER